MELFKAYIESETQLSWGNGIYNLGRLALAGLSIYHLNQGENNLPECVFLLTNIILLIKKT